MIMYLFQVTVCLACFYGFYFLALRKETMFHTNRMYLMVTLVVSLVLPIIKIYIDAQNAASNVVIASTVYVGNYVQEFSSNISSSSGSKVIPWMKILTGLYILGASVMAVRLLLALRQLLDIRKTGIQTKVLGCLCIMSEKVRSPFSFFNVIYLPVNHSFTEAELNEVIAHEMAHVHGFHTWDVIIMELLCIKLWPSPMIYLYRKSLKEIHEYVADAAVLKDTPWENYAQLLVSQQHSQLQNILSNQLIYSQLKKRLLMMNQERSGIAARYKYLGIIPVLMIALLFFSFRGKQSSGKEMAASIKPFAAEEVLLFVTHDERYFVETKEVSKLELETELNEITKGKSYPSVRMIIENKDETTISDLSELLDIVNRLHLRCILDTEYEGKFLPYSSLQSQGNIIYANDTLLESSVISMRLTEPEHVPSIPEDFTKQDYTLPMPVFPGCDDVSIRDRGMCGMEKLGEYINDHMNYPESLKKSGKEGRVFVKFIVTAEGYIKDAVIERSLDPAADQAVLDMVNGMNKLAGRWRPARKEGKSYDAEMVLPVTFTLGGNTKESVLENSEVVTGKKEAPYQYVEEMPRFNGCEDVIDSTERFKCTMDKLFSFVYENIRYPAEDKVNGVEGQGIVQFVVGADGRMSDIRVLRSPSPTISSEIIRMMNVMASKQNAWIPGKQDGVTVPVLFTLPVKFKLEPEQQEAEQKEKEVAQIPAPEPGEMKPIKVSPNPARDVIDVSIFEGAYILKIFDTSGNLVLSHEIAKGATGEETISISTIEPGQYVVQIISDKQTMTTTFVKI